MNPYQYDLSLRLWHPKMNLSDSAAGLGLAPTRVWQVGTPRRDAQGTLLSGVHAGSYWTAPLLGGDKMLSTRVSLEESLADVVGQLTAHRHFLISVHNSGGRCECFVGLISSGHYGIEIPAALMRGLADLGLDLGIDAYP
jgi:hypothetical protein